MKPLRVQAWRGRARKVRSQPAARRDQRRFWRVKDIVFLGEEGR